jgi:hypothetical protein
MKKIVCFVGVFSLLTVLFAACDSGVADGWIRLKVRVAGVANEESAVLRRSTVVATETVALASGQEWVVELIEEEAEPLRAASTETFSNNVKYQLIIFKSSDGTLVDYYSNGTVGQSNDEVTLRDDLYYDFVCYSRGSETTISAISGYTLEQTIPTASVAVGASGSDLLYWWSTRGVKASESTLSNVVLTPQRAQVRVKLDCSSGSTGKVITGVDASKITLGPLAVAGTIDPKTGDVPVPTSTSTMSFTWSSSALGGKMITSEPLTVLPRLASSTSPLTLSIAKDAIALDGVSKQEAATITLPNVALEAGKSYTLTLTPKMERKFLRWAGSNIYWDSDSKKLTFAEVGTQGKEMYQGVFFRWGSLVGIDPCKSSSTTDWHSSNTLYSPVYNGNDPTSSTWDPLTDQTWGDENPISLHGESAGANAGWDIDFFATYTADYSNKTGDICRYLSHTGVVSGKYRLPTTWELRYGSKNSSTPTIILENDIWLAATPVVGYWTIVEGSTWADISTTVTTDPAGKYVLPSGGNYSGYTQFPASGYRGSNGVLTYANVGKYGRYWSSSASSSSGSGLCMSLKSDGLGTSTTGRRETGSVRCLLDE